MRFHRVLRSFILALPLTLLALPTAAQPASKVAASIRIDDRDLASLLIAAAKSASFRALVDRIAESNLVVYVRCGVFKEIELQGRMSFLTATDRQRFAVIELACWVRPRSSQIGILAHELQHAAEIAAASEVVDTTSFDRFYARRGELVSSRGAVKTYETGEAVDSAARVRRELRQTDTSGVK